MPNINAEKVSELATFFRSYTERHHTTTAQLARDARERGRSPVRYRWDLFRAATPQSWINQLRDTTPGVSDAALDTAIRGAIKSIGTASNWATSLPLKH